ncbi:hypothetical protein PCANB_002548 [Pneumocystis canis]|nr:hypothetical protein PCANB_002548 [Pneumocystis canis]
MDKKEYHHMTVQKLKNICQSLGLSIKGKKSELIKRIEINNNEKKDNQNLKSVSTINTLNSQKELDKFNSVKIINCVLNDQKKLSKTDSKIENTLENIKTPLVEKNDSEINKNPSKKLSNGKFKPPINTPHVIDKEKQIHKLNVNPNNSNSKKLKKVIIKFIEKPNSTETNPEKQTPINQVVNTVSDSDIFPLEIGKPPSLAFRKKINIYSRLFAWVAFCLPSSERYSFLSTLACVCKLWNFSVKFAWYELILLEFPGKRTETWISSTDPTIYNFRLWYIHRQKEKQSALKIFRKSWIERELWFYGVSYNLLSDPDQKGQWEVAIRFWMSRFVLTIMSTEPWESWPIFFDKMYNDMIVAVKNIKNSDIWRIECFSNKVCEAIGWDLSLSSRDSINIKNITWKNLRFDWQSYISKLINNDSPTELFNHVFYHGDTSLYPHGVHKSIKDPLRFSLAKRFIISHVIDYSISGLYESRPFSYSLNPKLVLDLEQKYSVESVRLSGETAIYNQILCPGLCYIQTSEVGMFVLDEIGLEVGDDICGVRDIWTLLLGCNTWGSALDNTIIEKTLISLFQT